MVFAEASSGQPFSSDEMEKSSNVGMKGFKQDQNMSSAIETDNIAFFSSSGLIGDQLYGAVWPVLAE